MKVYTNSWLFKLPWLKNFTAITFLPFGIFFKNGIISNVLTHEMIHVSQIKKDGLFKFYVKYVYEFIKNLIKYKNAMIAYENISYEIEAYNKEKNNSRKTELAPTACE